MSNARSGDSPRMQRDSPEPLPPLHCNRPLLESLRKSQDGEVTARVHHGRVYSALAQALQRCIDSHAFGDSPEIELDANWEGHMPTYRVYLNAAPSSSWLPGDNGIETDRRKVIEGTVISQLHQLVQQGGVVYSSSGLGCRESSRQD